MIYAAGIIFQAPEGDVLFLRRGDGGDHPGEWCLPGGTTEGGETAEETARREAVEELGFMPEGGALRHLCVTAADGVAYTTFLMRVAKRFRPRLNGEHTDWEWEMPASAPSPLHPGVRVAVDRLSMTETDVAAAIRDGVLPSPQFVHNSWYFALRVTGTGFAYRPAHKELAFRDGGDYLTDEFLARCNGLPVTWEHPKKAQLDSKEFSDRVIGTVVLPYLDGDEVWGIARILDEEAAEEMREGQLSTSPGVVFTDQTVNRKSALAGLPLLVEGKPGLLDHLAVCVLGVWDKAGPPEGVLNELALERADSMADNKEGDSAAKADADAGQKLDKLLTCLDGLMNRMDAYGARLDAFDEERKADKARADAAEKEEAEKAAAADKARKDAASRRDAEHEEFMKADAEACKADDAEEEKDRKKYEEGGDTEEVAADKARKDRKDRMAARADKARKDAEKEKEEEERKADAARADSAATIAELRRQIDILSGKTAEADREEKAVAYNRADGAYAALALGDPPRAYPTETAGEYRARLLRPLQRHSAALKDVNLGKVMGADSAAFKDMEDRVYADALAASREPADLPAGQLREIRTRDNSGRLISTFVGKQTFIHQMRPQARRARFTSTNRAAG